MKARHYDIALIVGAAGCLAVFTAFDSDQAAKLFSPMVIFWMKTLGEAMQAMCITAKAFRYNGQGTPPDAPKLAPPVPDGA